MYVSYDHYRIFYYVARCKSFTRAAEELMSNQPNLTRAIKILEGELGCKLFTRSNKGVTLTPEGEKLYLHVSAAFEHIQAGEEEISLSRSMEKGTLSIGVTDIALRTFLLPVLSEFRHKFPGIRIRMTNIVSTVAAFDALRDGLIEIAIITAPEHQPPDLTEKKLHVFHECAICGEEYKDLSDKSGCTLAELAKYPIISLDRKSATYELYSALFAREGTSYAPDIEAAAADRVIPLVKHGLGIGFVPTDFLDSEDDNCGIYRIKLNTHLPERHISLFKRKNRTPSLPARELEAIASKIMKSV